MGAQNDTKNKKDFEGNRTCNHIFYSNYPSGFVDVEEKWDIRGV